MPDDLICFTNEKGDILGIFTTPQSAAYAAGMLCGENRAMVDTIIVKIVPPDKVISHGWDHQGSRLLEWLGSPHANGK